MKKKPNVRPKLVNSRKATRQNKRRQKKINRHEHYRNQKKKQEFLPNEAPGRFVKRPHEPDAAEIPIKPKKQKKQQSFQDLVSKERNKEMKEANQLKSQMEDQRRRLLVKDNEDEDKVIKKLEKQLGLNKSKNKNNFFSNDGLDYLLEICDRSTQEQVVAAEKHLANVDAESDFEDDLAAVTGKVTEKKKNSKKSVKLQDDNDLSDSGESPSEEGDNLIEEDDNLSKDCSNFSENCSNLSQDGSNLSVDGSNLNENCSNLSQDGSNLSEDGSNLSENCSNISQDGSNLSEDGSNLSENCSNISQDGSNLSEDRSNLSENCSNLSQDGSNLSEDGSNLNENCSNLSQDGSNLSEDGSNLSENCSNISQDGSNLSEDGSNLSENCSNLSQDGSNLSEDGSNLSENCSNISQDGSNLSDDENKDYSDQNDDEEPEEVISKTKYKDRKQSKQKEVNKHIDFESDDGSDIGDDDSMPSDDNDSEINEDHSNVNMKADTKSDTWEDIYGRKRDKDGNVIKEEKGIYVPPQFRNKDSTLDKEMTQLKRQIKSVLNKLSGSNLHWASSTIESLYSCNSRHSVSSGLTSLWSDAVVQASTAPDRMLAEHTALIAVLHANVGMEIGANFLQVFVKKFDEMSQNKSMEDKQLNNLVAALSYLYNFKLYQSNLLYDIFNHLLEDLCERHIDCVLTSLRIVGGTLRKEDPASLKTFIHNTQGKVAAISHAAEHGSRLKFLLEVLLAVKNNNLTKIPNYDPAYCEELKKNIKSIIRKGNYVTALNIRLEDLLKADERGKWWVVGSAWEGNPRLPEAKTKGTPTYDQKLLDLARKLRMNTEVRRSIFCIIMSAEDYMDAFEKLEHLGLRGDQQREIVHVLLASCLGEANHNPYYVVLANKLCQHDRKYQLSIQYTVWDKIKDLESLSKQSASNLAQFLTHLIMDSALPLSVLKVIEFSDLNKSSVKFMRQILLAIIMNSDFQASLAVFQRISATTKLHMFRESLRLFIQHFLVKNTGKKTTVLNDKDMKVLKQRTLDVEKILNAGDSKLKF